MVDKADDATGKKPEDDASRERGTVTEPSGSPFPDPRAPNPATDVEVLPGQPLPSDDHPDNGGVRAVRPGHEQE